MTNIDWYGHGPFETYCDRNYELIGRYHSTVDGMHTVYSRPQENGNISGVRSAFLSDGHGIGLEITANAAEPLNISARHHRHQVLEAFKYDYQVPPSNAVYLNIDHKLMGIAGINTWGAKPLDQYQLIAGPMQYSFTLRGHRTSMR
jgi:beta-galactosidase